MKTAMTGSPIPLLQSQRRFSWLSLALLASGCMTVLWPFAAAIVWAIVLAYVTWPLYRRIRVWFGRANALAAFVMTAAVSAVLVLPLLWLLILVHSELLGAFPAAAAWLSRAPLALPAALREVPGLGPQLSAELRTFLGSIPSPQWAEWLQRLAGPAVSLLGGVGRNIGKLIVTLLILFFLYRDGDRIVAQSARIMRHVGAQRFEPYLDAAAGMTRAVLFGFMVAALAQGVIAGVGYRIAGLNAPVLFGALTAILSLLPLFGTALIWLPATIWLLASGAIWQGIFLLGWGALVVHPIDNLLHPLLISGAARAPIPVVFLGVLGGLAAFGLVGIVIGPVLLGLALVLWREWGGEHVLTAPRQHR